MAQIILDSNNNLIQGDFDNATLNNRTKLQTTTTNATTNVYVVPNGSSTSAGVSVANNSSLTNASKIVMATNGSTDTQIISGVNGSGTYLPLSFYTNNALAAQISTSAVLTVTGTSSGIGYGTGSGSTVTQATSKSTGVTINTPCGRITTSNSAIAANTSQGFIVTNSACSATDTVIVNVWESGIALQSYIVWANPGNTNGYFYIQIRNMTAASLSETIVLNYSIIKSVIS